MTTLALLFLDVCVAAAVATALIIAMPLLTLVSTTLRRPGSLLSSSAESSGVQQPLPPPPMDWRQAFTDAVFFMLKGMLTWIVLLQTGELVGRYGGACACSFLLELGVRRRDVSLVSLLEPPMGVLDYLFLLVVAPALCLPISGVHGLDAAWLAFLGITAWWRTPSAPIAALPLLALVMTFPAGALVASYFQWRPLFARHMGCAPADDSAIEAAKQIAVLIVALLFPSRPRMLLMPVALVATVLFGDCTLARTAGFGVGTYHAYML